MNIIINADDLGISHLVNDEIRRAIEIDVISSSTLIANAPAFEEGVEIAKQYPHISIGAHLNLIEFTPLSNKEIFKKYNLIDQDGEFIEGAIFNMEFTDELKMAIKEEWSQQIEKIQSAGVKISHIDSHQHTHTIDDLQDVLLEVMKKYKINKVRRRNIPSLISIVYNKYFSKHPVKYIKKTTISPKIKGNRFLRFYNTIMRCRQWNENLKGQYYLTDGFYSLSEFYDVFKIKSFLINKDDTIELMCHPGLNGCELENDILFTGYYKKNKKVRLINYNEV